RTVLHIYFEHPCAHKVITPVLSPSQERRFGPSLRQQKQRRMAKKAAKKLRDQEPEETSYLLHTPYLSFHMPPAVLYAGTSRYAPAAPLALVHSHCFWRAYTIQLGPSLRAPGVIDPRGVVSWAHNGVSKGDLQRDGAGDGRALKGYRVRGWRLWGENGRAYVHSVRNLRRARVAFDDPDVDAHAAKQKARADEVVRLRWTQPLSRQTRRYAFAFRGVEFWWKGTGSVREARTCGWLLRFCHLKLVATMPGRSAEERDGAREVCLGTYTSSVAAEKSGVLEVFDGAVLRVVEERMPSLLEEECGEEGEDDCGGADERGKIAKLKRGVLYQLIVATVLCMASAEKEKRHTLIDLIIGIAENGG
ncbi:uncharacterized protein M421DRAFT_49582, partial [Didymella exigua CBS 183.55]